MKRAQEIDPLNPTWPAMQAWMNVAVGRNDEGLREVQKSLELNPGFAFAFHVLGFAYAGKGMYEQALAAQERAASLSPGYAWGVGYGYARMGRREDALRVAAALPPLKVHTLNRAEIHAALGDKDEACSGLRRATTNNDTATCRGSATIPPWRRCCATSLASRTSCAA